MYLNQPGLELREQPIAEAGLARGPRSRCGRGGRRRRRDALLAHVVHVAEVAHRSEHGEGAPAADRYARQPTLRLARAPLHERRTRRTDRSAVPRLHFAKSARRCRVRCCCTSARAQDDRFDSLG